jgi:hypothetical protein
MSKCISLLATALLIISSAVLVAAQTTTTTVTQTPTKVTKTVQNPDGSYTIIEYPVGKEVQLTFTPVSLTKSKAVGTILRDDTGTKVILNVTDVPADVSAINVYAVDDAGVVTLLGPVVLANGAGKFTATTPLSKFMLIAAPEATLTAYDPNAKIYFRSAVPEGFAVIPHTTAVTAVTTPATVTVPTAVTTTPAVTVPTAVTTTPATVTTTPATVTAPTTVTTTAVTKTVQNADITTSPVGEAVAATTTPGTTVVSTSTVPMLNIPAYKKGDDTKLKVDFTGAMSGARANIFIEPNKNGKKTEIKMVFHELNEAPKGQAYILWAVSPDNQFFKLGQIVNVKDRNEAEIKANTTLADFGLLVTMEDLAAVKTVIIPAGQRLGVIQLIP